MVKLIPRATLRLGEEIERHATWLEVFFDLIFAVIIIQLSGRLLHQFDFSGILKCSFLFLPLIWTWVSYTVFAARFDNDDMIHWTMTFVIMISGIIMAIQIPTALEEGAGVFSIGFLIGQITLLLLYSRTEAEDIIPQQIVHFYLYSFGLGTSCWIISLFFEPPTKIYLWGVGLATYLIMPWLARKRILSKAPLDSTYIPERFGAFTIIVLGQTIASVVFGLEYANWNIYSMITSIFSFILSITIFLQYYRFIRAGGYKCKLSSGQPYIYSHIPLIFSLLIMGVSVEHFIRQPSVTDAFGHGILCMSIILYFLSFLLLQTITNRPLKIRAITLSLAFLLTLLIFFPLTPYLTIILLLFIFVFFFNCQCQV